MHGAHLSSRASSAMPRRTVVCSCRAEFHLHDEKELLQRQLRHPDGSADVTAFVLGRWSSERSTRFARRSLSSATHAHLSRRFDGQGPRWTSVGPTRARFAPSSVQRHVERAHVVLAILSHATAHRCHARGALRSPSRFVSSAHRVVRRRRTGPTSLPTREYILSILFQTCTVWIEPIRGVHRVCWEFDRVDWEFDRVCWADEKGAIDVGDEGVSTTKWCSRRGRARKRRCAPASLLERDPRSRRRGGG